MEKLFIKQTGRIKSTKDDYLTRITAMNLICEKLGILDIDDIKEKNKKMSSIYRKLGKHLSDGSITYETIGTSDRIKQIPSKAFYEYAKKNFDLDIEELKPKSEINVPKLINKIDAIINVVKLEDYITKEKGFDLIKEILEKGENHEI